MSAPGESLSIPDRLVVSSSWGYFLPERIEPGTILEAGAQVGMVWDRARYTPIRCWTPCVFVRWLVGAWELVFPGVPLAALRKEGQARGSTDSVEKQQDGRLAQHRSGGE